MQNFSLTNETEREGEDPEHRRKTFQKIFDQHLWPSPGEGNPSGSGSTLAGRFCLIPLDKAILFSKSCVIFLKEFNRGHERGKIIFFKYVPNVLNKIEKI